jgi:hypothetical protein
MNHRRELGETLISLGRDRAIFFLRTGNLRPIDQSRHKLIDTLRLHPRCRTIQGSRGSRIALSIWDRGASTRRASSVEDC